MAKHKNHVVKVAKQPDGTKPDSPWHLVIVEEGYPTIVCDGRVFGEGEDVSVFKEKAKGKVTCKKCIQKVNWFKDIKL